MDFNKLFQQKTFKTGIIIICAIIVLLLVFKVGVVVGYKKAQFSYRWGENYHRNFAGPRGGFLGDFRRGFLDRDYINAHGVFGSIIKIDSSTDVGRAATIIVESGDNVEKNVLISDKTIITNRREAIKASDLKVDDRVVIIGSPNEQGQIEARFIRVFR
jgi:hypothetical protein